MLKLKDSHSYVGARVLLAVTALLTGACDKVPLLAPTQSTITVSAPTSVLPSGGSTEVTAFVVENSGTPVQNGTTVRFTATLGRVDPVEAQTRGGAAVTTFFAANTSGVAQVRATSGAASGGGTATAAGTNVVEITIGAAAVNTVSLRANPASVSPGGGSVELVATVVSENGQTLPGIVVTFSATQGSLSSSIATTNASGEARTTLATSEAADVTATAGTKTSALVRIPVRAGPIVTITCTPASGGTICTAVQASASNNTATVNFTIARPATGSSALRTVTIDFGDGTSQSLGNLATGTTTVTHTYSGPSAPGTRPYTATVSATDINGESASVSTTVIVTRPTLTPIAVNLTPTESTPKTLTNVRWTFLAAVTGGGEGGSGNATISSYEWDFGDDDDATTSGDRTTHVYTTSSTPPGSRRTVRVTVRTQDGRTATAREEIVVQYGTTP